MPEVALQKQAGHPGLANDTTNSIGIGFNSSTNAIEVHETGENPWPVAAKGGWQMKEVSLTVAQMLALTTPVELVAAPGAGYVLIFHEALFIYDYAAVFTVGGSDDLAIKYTNASGATVSTTLETTGVLDQTSDQIRTFKQITTDITPVANAALVLDNTGSDLTGTGSPCRMKVFYSVLPTGL